MNRLARCVNVTTTLQTSGTMRGTPSPIDLLASGRRSSEPGQALGADPARHSMETAGIAAPILRAVNADLRDGGGACRPVPLVAWC